MEEREIVQTIQFLLSASQQIYLAQVTEHIFKPSMTNASICKRIEKTPLEIQCIHLCNKEIYCILKQAA